MKSRRITAARSSIDRRGKRFHLALKSIVAIWIAHRNNLNPHKLEKGLKQMSGRYDAARAALLPHLVGAHLETCLNALDSAGLLDKSGIGRDGNSRVHATNETTHAAKTLANMQGLEVVYKRVCAELARASIPVPAAGKKLDPYSVSAACRAAGFDSARIMQLKASA